MIVKFDHITYVVARRDKEDILAKFKDRKVKFEEIDKENLTGKQQFLALEQPSHDLYFYEDDLPVEVICYDNVNKETGIDIESNKIYVKCRDLDVVEKYMEMVGFREIEKHEQYVRCNLKGILDKKDYYLVLERSENVSEVYLDDSGYGCVTVMVDSLDKLFDGNCEKMQISKPETITINKQELEVSFWRCENTNLIFEFIAPRRN